MKQTLEATNQEAENFADCVMKMYNEQLHPNIFGDTRPKLRKGSKDWYRIVNEYITQPRTITGDNPDSD